MSVPMTPALPATRPIRLPAIEIATLVGVIVILLINHYLQGRRLDATVAFSVYQNRVIQGQVDENKRLKAQLKQAPDAPPQNPPLPAGGCPGALLVFVSEVL
jgi:hypothetical protein